MSKGAKTIEGGELMSGRSDSTLDWQVNGLRKGYENQEVIRDKAHVEKKSTK